MRIPDPMDNDNMNALVNWFMFLLIGAIAIIMFGFALIFIGAIIGHVL